MDIRFLPEILIGQKSPPYMEPECSLKCPKKLSLNISNFDEQLTVYRNPHISASKLLAHNLQLWEPKDIRI
jgi:hypothetical protein